MANSLAHVIALAAVLAAVTSASVDVKVRSSRAESIADIDFPRTDLCPACEELLPTLGHLLGQNATEAEIAEALEKACSIIPIAKARESCEKAASTLPSGIARGTRSLLDKYSVRQVCSVLGLCAVPCCIIPGIPEQIRISLTGNPREMRVTWSTLNEGSGRPAVMIDVVPPVDGKGFNASSPTLRTVVSNETWTYTELGFRGFMHSVVVTGLTEGQRYYYLAGDSQDTHGKEWSQPALSFVGPRAPGVTPGSGPLRIVAYGDMGASDVSDNTVERVASMRLSGELDLVLHVGDISYADLRSSFWDAYLRKVEPINAYVPVMIQPGNHESLLNFVAYRNRIGRSMPQPVPGEENFFYSFDYGPVHVLALNTESSEDLAANIAPDTEQYAFVKRDLARAAANREAVPWIIVTAHRPFYCTTGGTHSTNTGCSVVGPRFRSWLEPLFTEAKVDLVLVGHRHNYEATWPVVGDKVTAKSYESPTAPVYVVSGNAGCNEHLQGFTPDDKKPEWSRVRIEKYGFSTLTINGASSLEFRHILSDTGEVADAFNITK